MINRFVIADANKCIGCRTCEIACAVSHNKTLLTNTEASQFQPRLKVIKSGSITTPVMCRQCDNAPCANVCPTGAIIHEGDSIQVIQERCIGCRSCAIVCPFGAMLISVSKAEDQSVKVEALKCDLCSHDEKGPACVSACPTKAISIVNPNKIEMDIQDRLQQTAQNQLKAFL